MGLFDFLKGREQPAGKTAPAPFPKTLAAPASGTFVPMDQVPDEVFSTGVLGKCCGIDPEEGEVHAPADGKITQVADSLHAVGIQAGEMELLIHVGVDTVEMNGDGFSAKVKPGQSVKRGDLLLTVDLEKVRAAGHPATVILAVTNTDDFASVEETASGSVHTGEEILRISK